MSYVCLSVASKLFGVKTQFDVKATTDMLSSRGNSVILKMSLSLGMGLHVFSM